MTDLKNALEGKEAMGYKHKILILYHSGAGSTKTIAEIYNEKLDSYSTDIEPISFDYDYKKLQAYDFIIFAFPTYHCSPSSSMMDFMKGMPVFDKPMRAFVFTTCGLFSGNALREFIQKCSPKNIGVNGYSVYRAPASDGILLLPPMSFMYKFEKDIACKIKTDIEKIEQILKTETYASKCPPFRFIEILNYPNKVCGKAYKYTLKIVKEKCVRCNRCIDYCIRKCWGTNGEYPEYSGEKCEYCFKCIHHCPKGAVILSSKTLKKVKLDEKLYKDLKERIIRSMK